MPQMIDTPENRRIACRQRPGRGPGVVFLGGFRSDMEGTKALHLETWARAAGRAFLRFDYSGHGASDGAFEDGCIGDWLADARAALALTAGPQVLIGSSMGGWIALLLAREAPGRVAGLVTVAAAPDFTEAIAAGLSPADRAALAATGRVLIPAAHGEAPYPITRRLLEDGPRHSLFAAPLRLACPVRFLQGSADAEVPPATALRLFDHAEGPDLRLILMKGADHRFSSPAALAVLTAAAEEVVALAEGPA